MLGPLICVVCKANRRNSHLQCALDILRIENGGRRPGCGSCGPINDRSPMRKFNIDSLEASKKSQRKTKKNSQSGRSSTLTPHHRYGHRLRTRHAIADAIASETLNPNAETSLIATLGCPPHRNFMHGPSCFCVLRVGPGTQDHFSTPTPKSADLVL